MTVSIAEYLGQRTDNDEIIILPVHNQVYANETDLPKCPFHGNRCKKIAMRQYTKAPICALRRDDGQYYIVCEHRLISTVKRELNHYRSQMLLRVAEKVFAASIAAHQVEYKREERILVVEPDPTDKESHDIFFSADFILAVPDETVDVYGPRRLVVEVQGGGETSNTGAINRYANEWAENHEGNSFLRSAISGPGTIQTNAWRRMQEQILSKGATAVKSGYGFAAVVGEVIMDYIERVIPKMRTYAVDRDKSQWDIAFIVFTEAHNRNVSSLVENAVELVIDEERSMFTRFDLLIEAMKTRGVNAPNAFTKGDFKTIENKFDE